VRSPLPFITVVELDGISWWREEGLRNRASILPFQAPQL
jgi:hypothetical protein